MTETETWILNEFANEIVAAMETGWHDVIEECEREYAEYRQILKQREEDRKK